MSLDILRGDVGNSTLYSAVCVTAKGSGNLTVDVDGSITISSKTLPYVIGELARRCFEKLGSYFALVLKPKDAGPGWTTCEETPDKGQFRSASAMPSPGGKVWLVSCWYPSGYIYGGYASNFSDAWTGTMPKECNKSAEACSFYLP